MTLKNQPEAKLTQHDPTRPFLEVIAEQAQHFHPYPDRLVEVFQSIPREIFVPEVLREIFGAKVHQDAGCAGILSQPGVIFDMVAYLFLKGKETVFEGGTGTGYQTAILARLAGHVYTVERDLHRLEAAQARLAQLGITNVTFVHGDAAQGLPQHAPFDRMIFGAAIHGEVDQPLLDQMAAPRSRLIVPTGTYDQHRGMIMGDLLLCDKKDGEVSQKINPVYHGTLSFVPLISPRPIGWTAHKGGYVPSHSPLERGRWKLPWPFK